MGIIFLGPVIAGIIVLNLYIVLVRLLPRNQHYISKGPISPTIYIVHFFVFVIGGTLPAALLMWGNLNFIQYPLVATSIAYVLWVAFEILTHRRSGK